MQTNHTPTPWRVQDEETGWVVGKNGEPVASVYGADPDCKHDAVQSATAYLIVRAVNIHDELLARLDDMVRTVEMIHAMHPATANIGTLALATSRAAIALAKHGGQS